jgi:hypothetical protein
MTRLEIYRSAEPYLFARAPPILSRCCAGSREFDYRRRRAAFAVKRNFPAEISKGRAPAALESCLLFEEMVPAVTPGANKQSGEIRRDRKSRVWCRRSTPYSRASHGPRFTPKGLGLYGWAEGATFFLAPGIVTRQGRVAARRVSGEALEPERRSVSQHYSKAI